MPCEYNSQQTCACTYFCPRHGKCCACVEHHRPLGEFPACFFSAEMEKTYDRNLEALLKDREKSREG
ncbi:MAG: DUF6485 family protein [Oscillospiraceae bacterium]|nr:DUF6485 family protein [Oscillospiraceae bacterium]